MKILICDDEKDVLCNTRERIEKILNEIMPNENNMVYAFENVFALYDYIEGKNFIADGIFMDINLKSDYNTDGINVAGRIKQISDSIRIIFFTGNIEYAEDIFKADPFDFAVKPVSDERLKEIIIRLKTAIEKDKGKMVTIKATKGIYKIMVDEIKYAESNGRYVYIHTINEKITTINKLDNIHELLGSGFVRCHKSYIVNENKIRQYDGERVLLFDNTEILVSRKYRHGIKEAMLNCI